MVKNKGGNKTKGRARKNSRRPRTMNVDDLRKIDGQEYAHALDKLGDGRFRLICYDKVARLGILRGTLKRFARCDRGAFVLVSIRDFEDSKCDIIHIYGMRIQENSLIPEMLIVLLSKKENLLKVLKMRIISLTLEEHLIILILEMKKITR